MSSTRLFTRSGFNRPRTISEPWQRIALRTASTVSDLRVDLGHDRAREHVVDRLGLEGPLARMRGLRVCLVAELEELLFDANVAIPAIRVPEERDRGEQVSLLDQHRSRIERGVGAAPPELSHPVATITSIDDRRPVDLAGPVEKPFGKPQQSTLPGPTPPKMGRPIGNELARHAEAEWTLAKHAARHRALQELGTGRSNYRLAHMATTGSTEHLRERYLTLLNARSRTRCTGRSTSTGATTTRRPTRCSPRASPRSSPSPTSTGRRYGAEGKDWPKFAQTMVGLKRLDNVHHCVERVVADNVPGDLIETGVWRGGVVIFMRALLDAYGDEDRVVYVADSFQGLPPPDDAYPADADSQLHTTKSLAISRDEVEKNFERYGLLDDRVRFLEGWFKDTLPTVRDRTWSVVRLDGDMYESTMDGLTNLYPQLSVGGFLIVDDYGYEPCRQAVADYREANGIDEPIEAIDWLGAFWRRAVTREDEPRFFFIHVMKTGGTSFVFQMLQNFEPDEAYPSAIDRTSPTDVTPYASIPKLLELSPERRARIRVYAGHLPYVASELLEIDLVRLTLLRDPVDRTVSMLKHVKRLFERYAEFSIDAIYDDDAVFRHYLDNAQTKVFALTVEERARGVPAFRPTPRPPRSGEIGTDRKSRTVSSGPR